MDVNAKVNGAGGMRMRIRGRLGKKFRASASFLKKRSYILYGDEDSAGRGRRRRRDCDEDEERLGGC